MPATPNPISGPLGPVWTPFLQAAQAAKQKAAHLAASQQQRSTFDQWMNTIELSGTNLNQVVTIGASHAQGGVEVWTGIANGTPGTAKQGSLAIGALTLTKGSVTATLTGTTSGSFSGGGNVIGAVDASGNNAINPGTTYTISGSTVTLSQPALEGGTSLYAAQAVFSIVS